MGSTANRHQPRQRVIEAALSVVQDGGLEMLTIEALVETSGVSNGSIYHHFGSRDGVIVAVFLDSFDRCIASLNPALDQRPARQVVPDLVHRYLNWIESNPVRGRFIYAAATNNSVQGSAQDILYHKNTIFTPIAEWFASRTARGEIRHLPVWSLDPVVMGPAHECARRFLASPQRFDLITARALASDAAWAIVRPTSATNSTTPGREG